ncbi:MAG: response regulator [Candidatus Obscuribacterales bacterium]|nr:response regulator [Candidatus Obscuribacterales bacterium]
MSESRINILVVDGAAEDAPSLIVRILESDPYLHVQGIAASCRHALQLIKHSRPDLITLDLGLPVKESLAFVEEVMENHPIPIVVISCNKTGVGPFDLLEAGALATVEHPHGEHDQDVVLQLKTTVKTMAEIKLVRRLKKRLSHRHNSASDCQSTVGRNESRICALDLVAIGASTGGPSVIQLILKRLPPDYPSPILIAQHIAPGFTDGLVQWLATTTGFTVKICKNNDRLEPSLVYLCPEGVQTGLTSSMRVRLSNDDCVNGVRPSVSYLFSSLADIQGKRIAAVLLTGMGRDGAEEMRLIKDRGGITIVQDAETSIVHGMPGEAIKLGAAQYVLAAPKIPELLVELTMPFGEIDRGRK